MRSLRILAATMTTATLLSACDRGAPRAHSPLGSLPLDHQTTRSLQDGDDHELRSRLQEIGAEATVSVYFTLRDALGRDADADSVVILPALARVADVLAAQYLLPEYTRDVAYFEHLDPTSRRELTARLHAMDTAFNDASPPSAEASAHLQDDLGFFRERHYPFGIVHAESYLATNAIKRGQRAESRTWFEACLADSRHHELRIEICDALSSLAMHEVTAASGDVSTRLDEALRLARESRLAGRAGRVYAIAGVHAYEIGRFGQSCDYFEEAVRVCRELGQAAHGLPYLVTLMRYYATFGDWNRVEALQQRARVLVTEARTEVAAGLWRDPISVRREELRLRELQARTLLARGRVDEAEAMYPQLLADTAALPFEETAYVHEFRTRGLLAAKRPRLALTAAREAVAYAEQAPQPAWLVRFRFHEAVASLACGDTSSARRALQLYTTGARDHANFVVDLRVGAAVLRAHLCAADEDAAATELARGLQVVLTDLEASDTSAGAYIDLGRAGELRAAMHEILGREPRAGYGIELLWRRLPGWLGTMPITTKLDGRALRAWIADLAATSCRQLAAGDAMHLLYEPNEARVVRWTATGSTVRPDTLSATAEMLSNQVAGALALLAHDPGDADAGVSPEFVARSRDLAEALLPGALRDGSRRPRTVLVSAEGSLALLPFATLNLVTPPDYDPLIDRCDVASVRGSGPVTAAPAPIRSLIVAAPEVAARLRRQFPGLEALAGSPAEAAHVATLLPDARILEGVDASLAKLNAAWRDVGCLYFACHVVRSPEAPYRTFLPLSPGGDADISSQFDVLDVAEIRAAKLGGVSLVVLAGCASGVPYVAGQATAPSLGDAFVDAGASAAIVTLWRVRDAQKNLLLDSFLRGWLPRGLRPAAAMGQAQRAALRGPDGNIRNPFGWAAYTLSLRSAALAVP